MGSSGEVGAMGKKVIYKLQFWLGRKTSGCDNYGDGGSPQGALQAEGALLRHPPVNPEPETPVQRWLDYVANLVTAAQRQLATGGRSTAAGTSRTSVTLSSSARRRARRSATISRRSTVPTSSGATGSRRRHDGLYGTQDARINIERRRDERRAARMGEGASSSGASRSSSRGGPPPTLTPGGTCCRAFVASLRNVRWPPKFRPNLTEKYDGSINPSEFLQIYTTVIEAAGGDDRVMANYFPMSLKGQARGWLMTQPPDSIHSWADLCQQFITNLQGTYPRPGEEADLHVNGVRHNRMLEKIASKEPKTTTELFELADKVARKEEAWAWNSSGTGAAAVATPESAPRSKRRDRRGKRKSVRSDDEGHVLAADGPTRAPRKGKATGDKPSPTVPSGEGRSVDKWCSVHNTYRHSLADCRSPRDRSPPLLLYLAATPYVVSAALVVEHEEGEWEGPPACDGPSSPEGLAPKASCPRQGPEAPKRGSEALAGGPGFDDSGAVRDPPGTSEQILHNREGTGRVVRWAIELAEFDLRFEPRHAIKSQILADFIAEWTPVDEPIPSNVPFSPGEEEDPNADIRGGHWVMHFDGSLNLQGAGVGVTLTSPNGDVLKYVVRLDIRATNNMAEYEGLLAGLRAAAEMGIRRLLVLGDSQLVVNQVSKEYQCTDPQMEAYVREHVPRRDNTVADELSRVASARAPLPPGTFEERLAQPSARPSPLRDPNDAPYDPISGDPRPSRPEGVNPDPPRQVVWMTGIRAYLDGNTLPEDRAEAEKLACISKQYVLVEGALYRRAANGILLKCIPREQGIELITDAHQGECGAHSASRTLVGKAFWQGFYWPTALQDAQEWVQRCEACQFHAKQTHQPAQALQVIPLSWPFTVWGLDILGPFKAARGGYQHLYVAIDKFTEWPEAYPVVKIDKHSALKFIRGITSRFGVPNRIITDNGNQFTNELFGGYYDDMGIKLCFASPAHPKSNGQVERANAEILKGLKTKTYNVLKKHGDSWLEELPAVLWANRTTPSRATGETPFFLVYGAEAVLPFELSLGSPSCRSVQRGQPG
uniref:OSIGBa0138H21-OSIGBa0138E01.6 protein n=1 Tax=Oryza sativa TaxID=4530 RepID=Q01HX7_ORYSA|nr:OSIGBa0138H21-OSIGBa0138E01.6 [Oryza sativa]